MPRGLQLRDGIEVLGDWGSAPTSKNADVVPHSTACENVVDTETRALCAALFKEKTKKVLSYKMCSMV